MNLSKFGLCLSIIFAGLTSQAELYCHTYSLQQGLPEGAITLKVTDPNSYYNGVITLSGQKLLYYFSNEIKSSNGRCYFNGGYGVNNDACDISAHLNLETKEIFIGGRFEQGLHGFSDAGGLKLLTTFNGTASAKNWFFNNCLSR